MIRLLVDCAVILALWLAFILTAVSIGHRFEGSPKPLLIQADYPLCVTIKPGPLIQRKGVNLYPDRSATA